jgi:hypothetical protein
MLLAIAKSINYEYIVTMPYARSMKPSVKVVTYTLLFAEIEHFLYEARFKIRHLIDIPGWLLIEHLITCRGDFLKLC